MVRECRAGMTDPLASNVSFRRLTPEEIEQREAQKRTSARDRQAKESEL